jgi:hypothetical protein
MRMRTILAIGQCRLASVSFRRLLYNRTCTPILRPGHECAGGFGCLDF